MRMAGQTDIGKDRSENQDNYRSGNLHEHGAYGVVCDGMGGAKHGKLASALAVNCIGKELTEHLPAVQTSDEVERLILDSIYLANTEIFTQSGDGDLTMGTTTVVAVVFDDVLHLAHVGDSRAYLYEDGALTLLTRDHSVVQEMIDTGVITAEEAEHHPKKNVITRALGVEDEVDVSYSRRALNAGAILLICTDGLTNMVPHDEILKKLDESAFFDIPSGLIDSALEGGGTDNITVLIMQRRQTADE